MIIRETPKDTSKYILVKNNYFNAYLQENGYVPMYVDNKGVYYKKSGMLESILNMIKKGGARE
jgi:hypothetical protein